MTEKLFKFYYDGKLPVGNLNEKFYFFKKLVLLMIKDQKNKLQKYKRTQKQVINDYDNGSFKKGFEDKSWKNYNTLSEFMFPKTKNDILGITEFMILNNKLCKVELKEFYKYRPIPLIEIIREFVNKEDKILELGSGWGRNLFYLRAVGFQNELEGYEFTEHGFKIAEEINKKFDCKIKFGRVDLTKKIDHSKLDGKTVFTQKVMEQLKYHTEEIIEKILEGNPKQVIHIEPINELYGNTLRDTTSKLYVKCSDYQNNLLTVLQKFERKNKIKILECQRLGFGANPWHEDSLIRWIPN